MIQSTIQPKLQSKLRSKLRSRGKINFTGIIMIAILFYGGFAAFKIISSHLTKTQIKNEIIEKFGFIRGPEFTPQKGEKLIREILDQRGVLSHYEPLDAGTGDQDDASDSEDQDQISPDDAKIMVQIDQKGSKISFQVDYVDIVDMVLFKHKAHYSFDHEMMNYN